MCLEKQKAANKRCRAKINLISGYWYIAYLLLKKVRSKHPYTHFEGKLYWAAVLVLLFNFILYFYGI